MEDAHIADSSSHPSVSFFAVFDGHGGSTVSIESAKRLVPHVVKRITPHPADEVTHFRNTIRDSLFELDQQMLDEFPLLRSCKDTSGCTANIALVSASHIYIANCGDSRSILARGGRVHHATVDHKPTDAPETARIVAAGGTVEAGRVCGNLAVSRSLGDFQYKDRPDLPAPAQKVSAEADIHHFERHADDEFLLLACDGIWDVLSNEEAMEFIRDQLLGGVPHNEIAENMLDHCLGKDSKDNMSVVLVFFDNAPKPVPDHKPFFVKPEVALTGVKASAAKEAKPNLPPYLLEQLTRSGLRPDLQDDDDDDDAPAPVPVRAAPAQEQEPIRPRAGSTRQVPKKGTKVGRNEPCPCNSGRKYKKCCGAGL